MREKPDVLRHLEIDVNEHDWRRIAATPTPAQDGQYHPVVKITSGQLETMSNASTTKVIVRAACPMG